MVDGSSSHAGMDQARGVGGAGAGGGGDSWSVATVILMGAAMTAMLILFVVFVAAKIGRRSGLVQRRQEKNMQL